MKRSPLRRSRHDGDRRGLPDAEAELLVEADRADVGGEGVQEHSLRASVDACHQRTHELRGQSPAAMVRIGADGEIPGGNRAVPCTAALDDGV